MERVRKPFQGVINILRFNRHFYLAAVAGLLLMLVLPAFIPPVVHVYTKAFFLLIAAFLVISLLTSTFVYDISDLYRMKWLKELKPVKGGTILNIHAGFDETSSLLQRKFQDSELIAFDFYNPAKHTELSIRLARKAFPNPPDTITVKTNALPVADEAADAVFLIMAAHEIRQIEERITFFTEVKRAMNNTGQLVVIEHLRDLPNFLAYSVGAFHFFTKASWMKVFATTGWRLTREVKITPFVSLFILEHGTAS